MLRKTLSLAFATMMALSASAQLATPDASWCSVFESALADRGVQAQVRCDVKNGHRVLYVTTDGRTYQYNVPENTLLPDFSSPVNVIVENFDYNNRREFRGDVRAWQGNHSSLYMPDEVFVLPSDVANLEACMRTALSRVGRVNVIDAQYALADYGDVPVYVLKTSVVALQRGEKYAPVPKDGGKEGPKDGGKDNNGREFGKDGRKPDNGKGSHGNADQRNGYGPNPGGRPDERKVERKFACGRVHVELVDYASGRVVWSTNLSDDDNSTFASTNPMQNVIDHLCRDLGSGLQRLCPVAAPRPAVSGLVLKPVEEAKNKTHTLYVGLGHYQQLRKGDVLHVYEVSNVAGREARQQIGSVSVIEVQGNEVSLCKVKKGEKDIYTAIHSGARLVVEGALTD